MTVISSDKSPVLLAACFPLNHNWYVQAHQERFNRHTCGEKDSGNVYPTENLLCCKTSTSLCFHFKKKTLLENQIITENT